MGKGTRNNVRFLREDMYEALIKSINELQCKRLTRILRPKKDLKLEHKLDTKESGLYWIYTDHSEQELKSATPSPKKRSIDFARVCQRNADVTKPCGVVVGKFRLVYSGIGGTGPSGHGGLRERILSEFRGGSGTGSLAIAGSSLSDLARWRVSYVLWSEIEIATGYHYNPFARSIEGLWRLHYGWPILCAH